MPSNHNSHQQQLPNRQQLKSNSKLVEGLEQGDLFRLVHNEIHVDEFKSKMGDDSDMVVLSFKVGGKEPAVDLVNFIEKGFDFIVDADTSAGELEDGDYIVFVEIERTPRIPGQIIEILSDMVGLTNIEVDNYRMRYHKNTNDQECTIENLRSLIPLTKKDYIVKVGKDTEELDKLKAASGVEVKTKAPKNEYTESLRIAAGIK